MIMMRCPKCTKMIVPRISYSLRGQTVIFDCDCGYQSQWFVSRSKGKHNGENKGFSKQTQS